MIYINQNTTIYVPRTSKEIASRLVFENQSTHKKIDIEGMFSHSDFYYKVELGDLDIEVGQYTYTMLFGDTIVESGVAQYGDFVNKYEEYNNDNIGYKTFDYD